jgi:DNA-directed RNA polymerase specialized sigma24 family protein
VERFALGIARNVRKEFLRNKSQLHRSMETTQEDVAEPPAIEMEELQALLQKELSRTERELFWSYYLSGTADRAKHRRKLAAKLEIEPEALRKRVSRLLERLRNARKKKTS